MRRLIPLVAGLAMLTHPVDLEAQQWTPAQQQVIDDLRECWDLWLAGVGQGSPEAWVSQCTVEGMTYWTDEGAPADAGYVRRTWDAVMERDLAWLDIRPIVIRIFDDVAVMHFYGYWRTNAPDGEELVEAKRTEVFKNVGGRWRMIAGHGTRVQG